jgi:hypothetical protein
MDRVASWVRRGTARLLRKADISPISYFNRLWAMVLSSTPQESGTVSRSMEDVGSTLVWCYWDGVIRQAYVLPWSYPGRALGAPTCI